MQDDVVAFISIVPGSTWVNVNISYNL